MHVCGLSGTKRKETLRDTECLLVWKMTQERWTVRIYNMFDG